MLSQTTKSASKMVKEVASAIDDGTETAEDKVLESTNQVIDESEELVIQSMDQVDEVADHLASHSKNYITEVTSNVLKKVIETPKEIVKTPNKMKKTTERKNISVSLEVLQKIVKSKRELSKIPSITHETISKKQEESEENQEVVNKANSDQKPSKKIPSPPFPVAITGQTKSPGRGLGGHQSPVDHGTGLHILSESYPWLPKTGSITSVNTISYFFDQWLHAPPIPPPELSPSNPNVF
ncbi:hypothetical protein RZN25_03845 [Bacillaceae bacterium S4-13-56]